MSKAKAETSGYPILPAPGTQTEYHLFIPRQTRQSEQKEKAKDDAEVLDV